MYEIERKFLINSKKILKIVSKKEFKVIIQGYLNKRTRIRIINNKEALITFKKGSGLIRQEFESKINIDVARELLNSCNFKVLKYRYNINNWEIDYFPMLNLWLAEYELKSKSQKIKLPNWIKKEVTENSQYNNFNLAKKSSSC